MTTIFEELRADHDKQRTLLDLLTKTEGDSEGRRELFQQVKDALHHHETAEERHFYSPLMEYDTGVDKSRHGIAEHHEMDELMELMDSTDLSSSAWLGYAKKLQDMALHHFEDEENHYFISAGQKFSDSEKTTLATRYREEMERLDK
ncbi:hemerythrin domain-containing protein [Larsenimonas rhizosphaerae]|uniref:Hemerythrin domain-containing protein n=1 Tax=Larsenimonas rhizosphaerae TaxID=2944682 RepID=A0AA41ZEZ0_9GAMM|nr:hemerythrin domain-containing protein [Larsenimonas rhizosphaerae]MCM2129949.1 hemerythrin domain-containing protein [Larsenimonas rhizosphaerae]MCX2522648.1 hemerythrin domain-containing protein [Larsenimonas rhizosphaerae]